MPPLGAVPHDDGTVAFRVWAPSAETLVLRTGGRDHELVPGEDGVFEATVEARPGDDYVYVVGGRERPDPCSRFQPEGIRGPSRIVDPSRFEWTDDDWPGLALVELVIYE